MPNEGKGGHVRRREAVGNARTSTRSVTIKNKEGGCGLILEGIYDELWKRIALGSSECCGLVPN